MATTNKGGTSPTYVRFVLKPEDMEHLIELLGDQEDALVYRLKAKWLEFQAEQAPPSKPAKRTARTG